MADVSKIKLPDNSEYNIKDASVPHSSLPASSGGANLSLVTTGEKYTWDSGSTDTKVTQTGGSSGTNYEVLFSETADDVTRTEGARKSQDLRFSEDRSFTWTDWSGNMITSQDTQYYGQLYLSRNGSKNIAILGTGEIYADTKVSTGVIDTGSISAVSLNGVTIGSSPKFTDTTYSSLPAASGGTDVSLVTTGEKYIWNNGGASTTDISSEYTITKTSGAWVNTSIVAYKTGNVIQLSLTFRGSGTAVSAGSNGFVGNITAGSLPVSQIVLMGFYTSTIILVTITDAGLVAARAMSSVTIASSGNFTVGGTFIISSS